MTGAPRLGSEPAVRVRHPGRPWRKVRHGRAGLEYPPRQRRRRDDTVAAHDGGGFQNVLELTDIAGPTIGPQPVHCIDGNGEARFIQPRPQSLEDRIDKEIDIASALAQRRQQDLDDTQTKIEVGPEFAGLALPEQVFVGRRYDAHIDHDRLGVAEARDDAVLEHAQELRLHVDRHLADFVQEQGATVGKLQLSDLAAAPGARERAVPVSEEFGFEELARNRSAIYRDERAAGSFARIVNALRDQFLAGTRLAHHQDARVLLRYRRSKIDLPTQAAVPSEYVVQGVAGGEARHPAHVLQKLPAAGHRQNRAEHAFIFANDEGLDHHEGASPLDIQGSFERRDVGMVS